MKVENYSSQNFGMAYIKPTHPYVLKEYKEFVNTSNFFVKRGLKQVENNQKKNMFNVIYERSKELTNAKDEKIFDPAAFRITVDNRYASNTIFLATKKTGLNVAFEEIDKKYTNKIARIYHKIKTYLKAIFLEPKMFLPEALLNAEKEATQLHFKFKNDGKNFPGI